jgi:hypothetical protein
MAEGKIEKILAPIAVGVGVIGVWLALRRPAVASPTQVVTQGPSLALPAVPPLQTQEYGPLTGPTGRTGRGIAYGTGASTGANPSVVEAANQNPLAPILGTPGFSLPSADYLSYNLPPWLSIGKLLSSMGPGKALKELTGVPSGSTFGSSCGCGTPNCPGGGSDCNQNVTPRQPDGHGSCLSAGAAIPQEQFDQQVGALHYFSTDPWNLIRPQGPSNATTQAPALIAG